MKQKSAGKRNTVAGKKPGLVKKNPIYPIPGQGNKTPPAPGTKTPGQGNKTPPKPGSKGSPVKPMPLPTKKLPGGRGNEGSYTGKPGKPVGTATYGGKPKRGKTPQAKAKAKSQASGQMIRNLAFQLGASKAAAARMPLRKG